MNEMKIVRGLKNLFILFFTFLLLACSSTPQVILDDDNDPTATPDPLESFYGTWLTDCLDFGGGEYVQLFANPKSNGELKLVLLTWNEVGCEGTYSMSDFEGNPLDGPTHLINYEVEDVSDIPDDFFVLKTTNVGDSSVTYAIFYIQDDEFYNLSDYSVAHDTWEEWLEEDDVAGFAADPVNYSPTVKGVIHFNSSDLPIHFPIFMEIGYLIVWI
jgi:hypothetical protein